MGLKHKRYRESRTPFPLRDILKNPRSINARVPQVMAQFVLKIEKLSHIMGPTPILEMARAYGLRPRLWLLLILKKLHQIQFFAGGRLIIKSQALTNLRRHFVPLTCWGRSDRVIFPRKFLESHSDFVSFSSFFAHGWGNIHELRRQSNGARSLTRFWLIYSLNLN